MKINQYLTALFGVRINQWLYFPLTSTDFPLSAVDGSTQPPDLLTMTVHGSGESGKCIAESRALVIPGPDFL